MRVIEAVISGSVFAISGNILAGIVFTAYPEILVSASSVSACICFITAFSVVVQSKTRTKALQKLLLLASVFSFLLPLSAVIYSGCFFAEDLKQGILFTDTHFSGLAIRGGVITFIVGITGFLLGVVFLISGLLMDRLSQLIYAQSQPSKYK
ncbi:MAG: hypothetical protein HGB36_11085 [Chlorobiaceae bacterium]|nr:hypothetical protein [Chlorobiaceae bacterium]